MATMTVTVVHVKDGQTCPHADISVTRSLQAVLECAGMTATPVERVVIAESLRIQQDVWHKGAKFWRG
jgi:hypothetical protein